MIWTLLAFLPVLVFADCGPIKNGAKVSLFDADKSLQNFKLQDQDGMGTCYANATSAILQGLLPNQPKISYTDLALKTSTHGWVENWKTPQKYKTNSLGEKFADGGFICETIAAVRKAGGACLSALVPTEGDSIVNPYVQNRLMVGLGNYFDYMNQLKKDPDKFKATQAQIAKLVPKLEKGLEEIRNECLEEAKEELPLKDAVTNILVNYAWDYMDSEAPTACMRARYYALQEHLDKRAWLKAHSAFISVKPESVQKLRAKLQTHQDFYQKLVKLGKDRTPRDLTRQVEPLAIEHKAIVTELVDELLPSTKADCKGDVDKEVVANVDGKKVLHTGAEDSAKSFVWGVRYAGQTQCKEAVHFRGVEFVINDLPKEEQCVSDELKPILAGALAPLLQIQPKIDQKLLDEILNPSAKFGAQIADIVTPGCREKKNLIPIDDVTCAAFTTCNQYAYTNNNPVYDGPADGCYSLPDVKAQWRIQALNAMKENRPLGVSICSSFLSNTTKNSDFCRNQVKDEGNHAMTLTGYRCNNGRLDYQVVNSWGSNHCPLKAPFKNASFECILDQHGEPTGKYWIKEDALASNATQLTTVRKAK